MKMLSLFVLTALLSPLALAAKPEIYAHKRKGAIGGADVVAYYSLKAGDRAVMGNKNIPYQYKGATWYFSNEKNRDLFASDPEKYLPQYGGYCAYAVAQGTTKSVNPNYWHLIDGKLYLNYSFFVNRKWTKDKEAYIAQANTNWPAVLEK